MSKVLPHDEKVYSPATDVQTRKRASPAELPITDGLPMVLPVSVPPHGRSCTTYGGGAGSGGRGDGGGGEVLEWWCLGGGDGDGGGGRDTSPWHRKLLESLHDASFHVVGAGLPNLAPAQLKHTQSSLPKCAPDGSPGLQFE